VGPRKLQFTDQGTLIGCGENDLFDFSPKLSGVMSPPALATGTIYSADTVRVPGDPGVKSGDRVILKGNNITFPPNFRWPVEATLKLESVSSPR
jgi:hypothetical protein